MVMTHPALFSVCLVGVGLGAACSDPVAEITCGPGTTEVNGTCVAEIETCGSGASLVDGECQPDGTFCAAGSTWQNGACVPDLLCGDDAHAEGDTCVSDWVAPPAPDFAEAVEPNGEAEIDLPVAGDAILLAGRIDTPSDTNADGYTEGDWDLFTFSAVAGTYLRLRATSAGATRPGFRISSVETASNGRPLYERYGFDLNAIEAAREVYLPRSGDYRLEVTDYNQLIHFLYQDPTLPVGGDDFSYRVFVENLGSPHPIDASLLPASDQGDLADGGLRFYIIDGLPAGTVVTGRSRGEPSTDRWSDTIPALMTFDGDGAVLAESTAEDTGYTTDVTWTAETGQSYLLVQDHWAILGPGNDYAVAIVITNITDCAIADCSSLAMAENGAALFRWDLEVGDFFVGAVYLPQDSLEALRVSFLDASLRPWRADDFSYAGNLVFGERYAPEPTTLYVLLRAWEEREVPEYAIEYTIDATDSLNPGYNYSVSITEFPPWTLFPAGIGHVEASAGELLFFFELEPDDTTGDWNQPNELIFTSDMVEIGPVIDTQAWNFPDGRVTPPFAFIKRDGHYLHFVNDPGGDIVGSRYTTKPRIRGSADLGAPTLDTPILSTGRGLGSGMAFFTFTGQSEQWLDVTVTPTDDSGLQPEVWVFNFGTVEFGFISYLWEASNDAERIGLIRTAAASMPGEATSLPYLSPYDGVSLLLVMHEPSGLVGPDAFDVEVAVRPLPTNDTCESAEPIELSGGTASVASSSAGATNTIAELRCLEYGASGADLFYTIDLNEGETLELNLTADWSSRLYLLTGCGDVAHACVAAVETGAPRELSYTVPAGGGGTYVVGVDSASFNETWVEADGDFSLDLEVLP